jgi:hypothetical protein
VDLDRGHGLISYTFFYTMPLMKRMKLFAVNMRHKSKPKLNAEVQNEKNWFNCRD